jgi:transposase
MVKSYFILKTKAGEEVVTLSRVSERTIQRLKINNGLPNQKPGKKPKINKKVKKVLLDYIKKHNTKTQQEMSDYAYEKTGLRISQPTISRFLKSENITRKKVSYQYSEQKPRMEKIKKFIKDFKFLYPTYPILFLDECSFHLNEAPRRGYSLKGSRAVSFRPGNKGSNITLILCIQIVKKQGVFVYELIKGGLETQNFNDFLSRLKVPEGKECYLFMDNLPVHRASQSCINLNLLPIKELLKSKRIIPIYLPAYTPQLNPVELCFNFLRQYIEKHQPRTIEELSYFMAKAMEELNKQDLRKYLKHCLRFYSKKRQK